MELIWLFQLQNRRLRSRLSLQHQCVGVVLHHIPAESCKFLKTSDHRIAEMVRTVVHRDHNAGREVIHHSLRLDRIDRIITAHRDQDRVELL